MNKRGKGKTGQVWVETVIYTLIAFVMIGLVLSYAKPVIEKMQDQAILEQSAEMMKSVDFKIYDMMGEGNTRVLSMAIKRGELIIDSTTDRLIFKMDSSYAFTEPGITGPGIEVNDGSLVESTTKKSGYYTVTLILDYSLKYNITYNGEDQEKSISKSSIPYNILVSNKGPDEGGGKTIIDFKIL